jgi:hypothetical protein
MANRPIEYNPMYQKNSAPGRSRQRGRSHKTRAAKTARSQSDS